VSGSTYQVKGLSGLTGIDGNFSLTVNSSGITDQNGDHGSNSLSTSWLMDTADADESGDHVAQARNEPGVSGIDYGY